MRVIIIVIFISISVLTNGQNRHLNLGFGEYGLCLGNSRNFNGLRLNFIDKNVDLLNGLNISLISKYNKTNGVKIAFHSISNKTNGLNLTIWGIDDKISNGLAIATGIGGDKLNGFGIGLLGVSADTINGFYFTGLIGTSNWSTDPIDIVNGVTIGIICGIQAEELNGIAIGINNSTDIQKGITIGLLNSTRNLYGIQLGLWNVVENNRIFKRTPIINFNFRRKASR